MALLAHEGPEGYGIYWMLLELLRDSPEYSLRYSPKLLKYSLHLENTDVLDRVVRQYGLFEISKLGALSSPWLCAAMGEYDERKKKLQEAGRRGAAHRWGGAASKDSEPIATLSLEDSEPIAYNETQYNLTLPNFILPDLSGSPKVGTEFLEVVCNTQPEGHASGYVAQVCLQYGMCEATHNFICEHSENAKLGNPTFERFRALVRRIQAEKWVPKHPDNFFIKKLFA